MAYPKTDANPNFSALEEEVLGFWESENVFRQSVEQRPEAKQDGSSNAFVFYDGPPFANGLPHYGHLLTGYVKDVFARYQTMQGRRVERRFGWDCHGLPAEMGAEKELNISGRQQIMEYGIEKFNAHCRESVMKYRDDWRYYVTRQARWVDFDNDYKTMDKDFMESVIWAFKQLYDKGWVYESQRVMPYSWAAETPLSNFETRLDNSYRDRTDKAVTVTFELNEKPEGAPDAVNYYLLAWTTTPWTLPNNLALAVKGDMKYVAVCHPAFIAGSQSASQKTPQQVRGDNCYILADAALASYIQSLGIEDMDSGLRRNDINGEALIGITYKPLFPYFANQPNAFRVLDGSDFIEEGSGTGVVHMAPGFGEDDQRVCAEAGIEVMCPVDEKGRYTDAVFDLPGAPEIKKNADGHYETERCILRPFTPEHEALVIDLHTNATVMDTVNDGLQTPEEAKADLATFIAHYEEHGFSQFAVYHKESGAFMGRAGLQMYNQRTDGGDASRPVLRAALLPEFWSNGYGREVCDHATAIGFYEFDLPQIVAGAVEHNVRSHRMIERIGYQFEAVVQFKNYPGPFFTITKDQYEAAHIPLSLKGLNVIEDDRKSDEEPYNEKQLSQFGLANLRIVNWLKMKGQLIKQEDYTHSYPHCWRTDKPLIYKAVPSWYVEVTKFKDTMIKENQHINWIPDHVKDGLFGKWLENARDWSISRNRFWGAPLPVWKSDNPNNNELYVFGSIAELNEFFDADVQDLHRPFIDELTKPDPKNANYTIRRVEDVFDCWFESGSMPYAQVHYPFENKEWFEANYPADFIVEYMAQTRGWFYTLVVLAAGVFDAHPFKNCICHGVVMSNEKDANGHYQKLSKRLKNYADPKELFDQYGADALRWFMLSAPVMRGQELYIDREGKFIRDVVRLHIKPLWNAYNFFTLYANADGLEGKSITTSDNAMDRYILAKCKAAAAEVKRAMDTYDTPAATTAVSQFFEILNNWYIRRSRERFWRKEQDADKQSAYDTLYTVLEVMCRVAAPLLPLVTEKIYQGLCHPAFIAGPSSDAEEPMQQVRGDMSVHLHDYPDMLAIDDEAELVAKMDRVRDACNTILSIRNETNIRIRQPLASATLYGPGCSSLHGFEDLIADETNVKEVRFSDDLESVAENKLTINFKVAGKRLGPKMKSVGTAAKQGEWSQSEAGIVVAGEALQDDEYDLQLMAKNGSDGARALASNDALVMLDTNVTPELEREGVARDVVRMIQQARKDADLQVSDRINVWLQTEEQTGAAVTEHKDFIAEQTLAASLETGEVLDAQHRFENQLDGKPVVIGLSVAA